MSSARCLNWSRPPPGRHPALRKQVSCIEPSYSPSPPAPPSVGPQASSHPHSVNSAHGTQQRNPSLPGVGSSDFCQFLVTSAIIHTNRFQNYHTYNQARRGGSASLVRQHLVDDPGAGKCAPGPTVRRPASASVGQRTTVANSSLLVSTDAPRERVAGAGAVRRGIVCRQLSLDQSILLQSSLSPSASSSFASGMATVASGGSIPLVSTMLGREQGEAALASGDGATMERTSWSGFSRKQQRAGAGLKNDSDPGAKKGLKADKDARINIKIFLGQTVQQDSSDTGVSDTEGTIPAAAPHSGCSNNVSSQKCDPSSTNMSTEAPSSAASSGLTVGKTKATNGNTNSSSTPSATNTHSGAYTGTNWATGSTGSSNNGSNNTSNGGRSSSLAQRRAQFQANRQSSEAHDRRHPPLVRALSAPIRPADPDTSKFLQGKKKPRRRKVLREKDEYNICEEDEFSDDGDNKAASGNAGVPSFGMPVTAAGKPGPPVLPMRSRSVLGGACDIETLVSLLSSGGSDSEKEQDSTQTTVGTVASHSSTSGGGGIPASAAFKQHFSSAHLSKGRAPMLKKAGKSVSFQESDLKPAVATAGLNRDYRKPSFQPMVASRIRRTQQLVSTLNAFQLKEKDKSHERDSSEEKHGRSFDGNTKAATASLETPSISSSTSSATKTESHKSTSGANGGTVSTTASGDVQTPKEQECYRLFLKMSKKGLAVSYDTILRGMLTPTELRVLQKKKNRQRNSNGASGENAEDLVPETAGIESGAMPFEELHLKELHFHHTSQAEEAASLNLQLPDPTSTVQHDEKECETEEEHGSLNSTQPG